MCATNEAITYKLLSICNVKITIASVVSPLILKCSIYYSVYSFVN